MEIKPEIVERLKKLEEKYAAMGQDLVSYLDGLLHADYVTYWDYIQVDTLLSLQKPRTSFPDEEIFIMYHQITELYFKLVLHEMRQLAKKDVMPVKFMVDRMKRINRYFQALTHSFAVMIEGMEKEQFLQFRMSLLPASGFQSAQYRMIEICATDFYNLVDKDYRPKLNASDTSDKAIEEMFEHIYWKKGATELATGKKTLTLMQFEKKYKNRFVRMAKANREKNIWALYQALPEADRNNEELINAMKFFDVNVNINWPLVHYKSAARYLQLDPEDIAATGGTNWQKYLPPRFQKRIFYPELWSEKELDEWGKGWVEANVLNQKNLV
jgi:tryptophan 2,3-dioxygenase